MRPIALNMLSMRPGYWRSQSRSICLICTRCRLSWLPHSVHGMIGNCAVRGPALEVGLGHVGQRADHDVAAVVADQLGRHALQPAAEEHVHEQRLQHVVAVVAERDLGRAQLAGHAVQDAAAQPRAQAAHRLALGDQALDDRVGVLLLDVEGHAARAQVLGQHVLGKAGLLLVEVDGDDVERHRRALAQVEQDVEQRVAVLAARHADHHLVAGFDHVEVDDRLADLAVQALGQLVGLERWRRSLGCGSMQLRVAFIAHLASLIWPEHLDADRVAVGVHVGLLGRHARARTSRGCGQHRAQRCRRPAFPAGGCGRARRAADRAADEVVVDHLVDSSSCFGVDSGQRHVRGRR